MEYVFLTVGLLLGALIVWLVMKGKVVLAEAKGNTTGEIERTSLSEQLKAAVQERTTAQARLENAERKVNELQTDLANLRETNGGLKADAAAKAKRLAELQTSQQELSTANATIAQLNTTLEQERLQNADKLTLLIKAREELSNQFKALANAILDDKAKKFTEQNQTNLTQILNPFKEKITAFQVKGAVRRQPRGRRSRPPRLACGPGHPFCHQLHLRKHTHHLNSVVPSTDSRCCNGKRAAMHMQK